MKIVVFQLHVRGWVESIGRTLVMTSPKCRVVKVPSAQKSNLERMMMKMKMKMKTALNASGISPP